MALPSPRKQRNRWPSPGEQKAFWDFAECSDTTDGRDFKSVRVTLKDNGTEGRGGRLLYRLTTRKQGRQKLFA